MKNVIYYNAGAGSGKTYRLTHLLADKVREGVNPAEMILTTFTNKAADDLRQRARAVLYEEGLHEAAALLDQAIIGTVHSLGQQFVSKFWYLLGLSPNMNVMDDDATTFYINRSLSHLPTPADIELFRHFRHNFDIQRWEGNRSVPDDDFWKSWLKEVIDKATWYRVDDFEQSAQQSIAYLRDYFKPDHDFNKAIADYRQALLDVRDVDEGDTSKAAIDRVKTINEYLNKHHWSYVDYDSLGRFFDKLPKKCRKAIPQIDDFVAELTGIWHSRQVFADIERVVRLIFEIAAKWKAIYAEYKAERRILDFNDMEHYFITLLQKPECRQEISGRYKVLMVDEFQDSSPVQVDIFDRLSDMVEQSYWCGDSKQAIYGFRGADTDLTEAVVAMIEAEDRERICTLDKSYRSEPDIVDQCNAIFCKVFAGKLDKAKVELKKHRIKESDGPSLIHWHSALDSSDYIAGELVDRIQRMAKKYGTPYHDIAVLARTNSELNIAAEALIQAGIPVNYIGCELCKCKEIELVSAILTLIVDPVDALAKARIAYLSTQGFTLSQMIESRIAEREQYAQYMQERQQAEDPDDVERPQSWLADNPIVAKVLECRDLWQNQGVSAMIETLAVELNLRAVLKSWGGSWQQREDNIYQYVALAERYEGYCRTMAFGASVNGFINWSRDVLAASCGDASGVVLSTFHRSKGLEWRVVIVVSLDDDAADVAKIVKREVFGVHQERLAHPTRECLFPGMRILLMPNVFTGRRGLPPAINMAVIESERYFRVRQSAIDESARLLYVAMTRGRDRVVTYTRTARKREDPFAAFTNLGIKLDIKLEATEYDIFGTGIKVCLNPRYDMDDEAWPPAQAPKLYDIDTDSVEHTHHEPRYVSPSAAKGRAAVVQVAARSGRRILLRGNPDMSRVGDCLHNSYAAFTADRDHDTAVVKRIKAAFSFLSVLPDTLAIVDAYTWLMDWLNDRYGEASAVHHELPFMHATGQSIVRGSMDLVYEAPGGCVLIDFKTFPGKEADVTDPIGRHYAGNYGPQFACYQAALRAAHKSILASYVYYPVAGLLVSINGQ